MHREGKSSREEQKGTVDRSIQSWGRRISGEIRKTYGSPVSRTLIESDNGENHGEKEEVLTLVPQVDGKEFHGVSLVVAGALFVGGIMFLIDLAVVKEGFVDVVVEGGVVLVFNPVLLVFLSREPERDHGCVERVGQPGSRWSCFLQNRCGPGVRAGKDVVADAGGGKVEGKVGSDLVELRPVFVVVHDNDSFHELGVGDVGVVRMVVM